MIYEVKEWWENAPVERPRWGLSQLLVRVIGAKYERPGNRRVEVPLFSFSNIKDDWATLCVGETAALREHRRWPEGRKEEWAFSAPQAGEPLLELDETEDECPSIITI